ncbi:MAG: prepilin-type N-terminal cleavage/methylation domain-containing protein [Elusimicrobiaceae bacterium]|nr:prepilin-type N-terminal cleavage/methylation domain-containing protein [Elusimicrobiaceae bacterium]
MTTKTKAFTLIELLVVVLIIGILTAIALPQYQKAAERSQSSQAVTMLKSVYQAAQEYYLANGTWPTSFADLSVAPPWAGETKWYNNTEVKNVLSNDNWSLQMINAINLSGLNIGRVSGPYTGGGFAIWNEYTTRTMPLNTIVCAEKIADIETPGDYCQKVMQAGKLITNGKTLRYYKMP